MCNVNPRSISDERFQNLCRSLTIFAGNMRYRAAQHLGWDRVPAFLVGIPEQLARERALRDNAQWGEWEEDELLCSEPGTGRGTDRVRSPAIAGLA